MSLSPLGVAGSHNQASPQSRGLTGKHFPTCAPKPVSSLSSAELKSDRSLHLPQASVPTVPRHPGFGRAHLSLTDFTPYSNFFFPNAFSPCWDPPKQSPPNYFSLIGPRAAKSVPKFYISEAPSAQSGATGRVVSRRGRVPSMTPFHPSASHQFYLIPSTGSLASFICSLDSPASRYVSHTRAE